MKRIEEALSVDAGAAEREDQGQGRARQRERERERENMESGAGILYAFVGRGRTVWADHQATTAFQNPQKTASQMLAKLSQVSAKARPAAPRARVSFVTDDRRRGTGVRETMSKPRPSPLAPRPPLPGYDDSVSLTDFSSCHQKKITCSSPSLTLPRHWQRLLLLPLWSEQEGKYTFQLSEARTAYCLVVFGCVASSTGISSTSAMVFLGDLNDQFYCQFAASEVQTCAETTTQFRRFSMTMKKAMEIAYSGGQGKISEVKRQIEDTRQIMSSNIDKVLERGERLEDVMGKSEAMKDTADQFRKKGRELRRKMWWQNTKMKLIIAGVVLLLILIIFFAACSGVTCVTK